MTVAVPTHRSPLEAPSPLEQWVADLVAVEKVAQTICKSAFVPDGLKDPGNLIAAILAGQELGLDPMAAAQSFSVIKGKAVLSARQMLALTMRAGHDVEVISADDTSCHVRGRRKGAESWTETTWTIDRARRMGLASKDNWKRMPQQMLEARAISEICRRIAPDALAGLTTSSEEMQDSEIAEAEVLSRKPLEKTEPAVEVEADFTDEEVAAIAAPKKASVKRGAEPITKNAPPPASPPPAPARQDKSKPASKEAIAMIVTAIESQGLADDAAKIEELQRATGSPDLSSPADMTEAQAVQAAKTLGMMG